MSTNNSLRQPTTSPKSLKVILKSSKVTKVHRKVPEISRDLQQRKIIQKKKPVKALELKSSSGIQSPWQNPLAGKAKLKKRSWTMSGQFLT